MFSVSCSSQMWCEGSRHTLQLAMSHLPAWDSCHGGITLPQAMNWNESFIYDIASCKGFSHSNKKLAPALGRGNKSPESTTQCLTLKWRAEMSHNWEKHSLSMILMPGSNTFFYLSFISVSVTKTSQQKATCGEIGLILVHNAKLQSIIAESQCCRDLVISHP